MTTLKSTKSKRVHNSLTKQFQTKSLKCLKIIRQMTVFYLEKYQVLDDSVKFENFQILEPFGTEKKHLFLTKRKTIFVQFLCKVLTKKLEIFTNSLHMELKEKMKKLFNSLCKLLTKKLNSFSNSLHKELNNKKTKNICPNSATK